MCSLVANDKTLPSYEDDQIIIVDRPIPKHATTEALEALGDTINFIDIWIKLFEDNYDARRVAYITSIQEMFNKLTQTMIKALTSKQKVHKLMT